MYGCYIVFQDKWITPTKKKYLIHTVPAISVVECIKLFFYLYNISIEISYFYNNISIELHSCIKCREKDPDVKKFRSPFSTEFWRRDE